MASARDRLALAQTALDAGFPSGAASAAYYAMLYAVRAALSESERNARTHSGSWALFRETFVAPGGFDESVFAEAHATQQLREAADYDALMLEPEQAREIVALADRFVEAVTGLIGA